MFWLRLSGWLFVLLLLATAAVMFLGGRLPTRTTTSVTATMHASPDRLWPLLTDPTAQPHWRTDVTSIDPLPDDNGLPCWLEQHNRTMVPVCIAVRENDRRLVLRTSDARLPFHGERRFDLTADPASPSATRVTITETVSIAPPMVRFYDHYVSSQQTRVERLAADLVQAVTASPVRGNSSP